jgi:hypothetical protein
MIVTALNHWCSSPSQWAVEASCGLFLALPMCGLLSQWEKRLVVRRSTTPTLAPCRIAWWPFLFASVDKLCLEPLSFLHPKNCSIDLAGHAGTALMALVIRATFMLTGLYLGQSFFPLALTGSIATGM